ncbi:MAG: ABC transporter ATP-binding protein, partial [Patescibacteria group bacterium]
MLTKQISFSWRDLVRAYWFLLGDLRWKYLGYEAILVFVLFYQLVPPLLVGLIVDFFTTYQKGDQLAPFYLYTLSLGISFCIVAFIRLTIKQYSGDIISEIKYRTKVRGFERLLDHSLAWHFTETAGAKVQRIKNGVDAFRELSFHFNNEILRTSTTIIGAMGVFLFLRPIYGIFFLVYLGGFWLILTYFYNRVQRENDHYYLSIEQAGGVYTEGLSNIVTIKTLGADKDFKHHLAQKEHVTKEHEFKIRAYVTDLWKSFQIFNGISYGAFLFIVGRDIITGIITPGTLVVFYGYLQALIGDASDITGIYEKLLNAKSGIGRMMGIFWGSARASEGKKVFPSHWDRIALDNASFSYRKDSESTEHYETLSHIALTIPRNTHIGIVGKTGSGKSTLAKVLAGLYPLDAGTYHIGDTSFTDLTREEQIHHITLLLQETEVFNLSFRENVTLMKDISSEKLAQALAIADLEDVVAQLPDGLETLVGEKGYHLSGGERQRLGIARAVCRDADILIFDEATSSLDSKTEKHIQHALETHLSEKTLIVIAHRVSTLQNVDRIYVFDKGAIVEDGTFDELSR